MIIKGNKITEYEKEHNRLSYKNLIDYCFCDMVLCNNIVEKFNLDLLNNIPSFDTLPDDEKKEYIDEDDYYNQWYDECYQYYIVELNCDEDFIINNTNLLLYYCDDLEVYVLGVDHFGTSWDYILTNAKLDEIDIYYNH